MADDTTRVGAFETVQTNNRLSSCDPENSGITHNSRSDKRSVMVRWIAPDAGTGPIRFGCAVTQVFVTVWANARTAMLNEAEVCNNGDVRLVDGSTVLEGRVEICFDGVYGTVCDDEWSFRDARVVCRQLDLPFDGVFEVVQAGFGEGLGPIYLDDVDCNVPSLLFQLRLGPVERCVRWTDSEVEDIEQAIQEAMVEAIRSRCECDFTAASIGTGEFSCQTTATQVIYRSTLEGTETHSTQELREFAEDWVSSGPTIPYSRFRLRVRTDCPFLISSLGEPECLPGGVSEDVWVNRCAEVCLARVGTRDRFSS